MGDDKAVLRKIRIGQLQGGALVSGSLADFFADIQLYSLPLTYHSYEEVDYVRERMDQTIIDGLEKNGFVSFGLAEGGFAHIMSKAPVRTLSDLRNQKVWIPDNDPMALATVKAFGISPIPLSIADVRTGLQTGLIDTVSTPPIGAVILQWHTQIHYLTESPLMYVYALLVLDHRAFSKIAPADQGVLREIMGRVFTEIDRQNRRDNVKALEVLRKQGVEFVTPPVAAMQAWHAAAAAVPDQLVHAGRLSKDLVDTMEGHLAKFRSPETAAQD
jgi:TRAP-type C4-dicarboxylate transport system substrate-binding protein